MMHPYIQQKLIDARIAEIRSEAKRHRMTRTVRRARHATQRPVGPRIAGHGSVLHHVLSVLHTIYGQQRQSGPAVAQVPEGMRP